MEIYTPQNEIFTIKNADPINNYQNTVPLVPHEINIDI